MFAIAGAVAACNNSSESTTGTDTTTKMSTDTSNMNTMSDTSHMNTMSDTSHMTMSDTSHMKMADSSHMKMKMKKKH